MPVLADERREIFAQHKAKGESNGKAFVAAGFKASNPKSVSAFAARIHAEPKVKARIKELQANAAKRAEISIERVLLEFAKVGFANIEDYLTIQPDGTAVIALNKADTAKLAAVAEVTVDEYVERGEEDEEGEPAPRPVKKIKFKLHDKLGALNSIGKHLGMFKERVEHTGADGAPIEVSDTDAARRVAFLLAKGLNAS